VDLQIPDGLLRADAVALKTKVARFSEAGSDQLQVIFDFDRTLTTNLQGSSENISSSHIMNFSLPPDGRKNYQQLFEYYRPLEIAGTMTTADAVEWWSRAMRLFVDYRVDMTCIKQDFLSKVSIRPHTKEVLDLCKKLEIPTIILSAGVKNVIDMWMEAYDVRANVVLGNVLQIDVDGKVCGWDESAVMHIFNKHETGHPELARIRAERSKTILIGDGMSDADMAEGTDDVLRIRILDVCSDDLPSVKQQREQTFQRFDAAIEDGSLQPLYELLQQLAA